ncbi:hypothetical protein Hte_000182 [Hypoxylon texense]
MASRHDSKLSNDDSIQGEMASKLGKYQRYPPPQALPDYLNRALPLPPRPSSNSSASSLYDSPGESTQGTAKQIVQSPQPALTAAPPQSQEIVAPQPRYPASKVLEVKNYVVSPVSASLPSSNSNNNQQHDEVSPVSPGGSERSLHSRISESSQQPSSPSSSSSASAHHGNSASSLQRTKSDRRRAVYRGYRTTHSAAPGDPGATSPRSPRYQVHQINDRYSDPGSPISGAVIHPPTSFPSDPSLRSSRQLNEAKLLLLREQEEQEEQQHQIPAAAAAAAASNGHSSSHRSNGGDGNPEIISSPSTSHAANAKLATVPSSAGSGGSGGSQQKVTFASLQRSDSGFAARPRAGTNNSGSRRTGKPPPPPLKLSERAIVDTYVKTPFPVLGKGGEEGEGEKEKEKEKEKGKGKKEEEKKKKAEREKPVSRFSHGRGSSEDTGRNNRGAWLGKGKDKDKDKNKDGGDKENENEVPNSAKKRNRVSSLPGFGLGIGRILRTGSVSGYRSEREKVQESRETGAQTAESQAQVQSPPPPVPSEVRSNYVETRASRPSRTPSVSKVKNMLSKAKQIGLNHGLGLGMMSSEEAKKERRRAEMKRQIRVGDPRPV